MRDVVVVGGGVVGVAIAARLAAGGADVELLERGRVGGGASEGNAGQLRVSECIPLAAPGAVGEALRLALRPQAPVRVRPTLRPGGVRWLLGFARAARGPIARRTAALAALGHLSARRLEEMAGDLPPAVDHRPGALDVFETPHGVRLAEHEAQVAEAHGFACQLLDAAQARALEPALGDGVAGAIDFPGDGSLDPSAFTAYLAQRATEAGATLREATDATSVAPSHDGVAVTTAGGTVMGRQVVLATGSAAGPLDDALPLLPGKGYSVDLAPAEPPALSRGLVLLERHAAITPIGDLVRVGSDMVVGAFDRRVPNRVVERITAGAPATVPRLAGARLVRRWAGLRPLTPDGVPLIGRLPDRPHIVVATGHAMLGVSFALGTAELVAALLDGRDPPADMTPFEPDRFRRTR